jgi:glycosyltransferase involved in cell wall biosynthesis
MRILLITDWMSDPGGAETYMTGLREALRASGDEVRLLTCGAGSGGDGSPDYRAFGTDLLVAQAFLQIANPFAAARVRAVLREFRPDVVLLSMFAYHLSPAVLPRLRGVPTVLSLMDYKCICPIGSKLLPDGSLCTEPAGSVCWRYGCVSLPHWIRDRPRYALLRTGLKHVRRVLSTSRWMQRELEINGVPSEHVPLPVPAPPVDFRRAPAGNPVFVYCGRLSVEKGLTLLLRAFDRLRREMPTVRLRIVGDGPQRSDLERLVGSLSLQGVVTFTGRVAPSSVQHELVDAWALVAPSQWAEPFGLVALEAIVRGLPVIASASGGFGETVEHGVSGLLFPNGNEGELVECLRAVADSRAFPSHSLPNDLVREVTDSHSPERHVARLHSIFAQVVSSLRLAPAGPL